MKPTTARNFDALAAAIGLTDEQRPEVLAMAAVLRISPAKAIGELLAMVLDGPRPELRPAASTKGVVTPDSAARHRLAFVREWLDERRRWRPGELNKQTAQFVATHRLPDGSRLSVGSLRRLHRRWMNNGLAGLVDMRRHRQMPPRDGRFIAEVARLRSMPCSRSLAACVRQAEKTAKAKGWPIDSYKTCQRAFKATSISRADQFKHALKGVSGRR